MSANLPFKISICVVKSTNGPNTSQDGSELFKYGALSCAFETLMKQLAFNLMIIRILGSFLTLTSRAPARKLLVIRAHNVNKTVAIRSIQGETKRPAATMPATKMP